MVNSATGAASGVIIVGGAGNDLLRDAAVDGNGNTWVAGYVEGPVMVGATPTQAIGVRDALVYREAGGVRWRAGAASQTTEATAIAFNPAGQLIVVGSFEQTVDLGSGVTLTGRGARDVFVCALSPDDGTVTWATSFGGPGDDDPTGVTVLPSGDIVVTGTFSTTADFGGVSRSVSGQTDWFIASLPNR